MKIMLTVDLSVGKEHGMTRGKVLDVDSEGENGLGMRGYWVTSVVGEPILVFYRECEVL
jgi:hypothetical protein